jgi:hypothetical protein
MTAASLLPCQRALVRRGAHPCDFFNDCCRFITTLYTTIRPLKWAFILAQIALTPARRMAVLHLGAWRMTVFESGGKARTSNYQDVGSVPFAMAHYVENLCDEPLRYLEMFRSPRFVDVSLNQ